MGAPQGAAVQHAGCSHLPKPLRKTYIYVIYSFFGYPLIPLPKLYTNPPFMQQGIRTRRNV